MKKRRGKKTKAREVRLPGVWEVLGPAGVVAYERLTREWDRAHTGATGAETQAAWAEIAKGLRLRARRFRGGVTDELLILPPEPPPIEHQREWTAKQFLAAKRRWRSAAPVTWRAVDAAGRQVERELLEREDLSPTLRSALTAPLPPPKPQGGRPPGSYLLTDEVLQAALDARGLQGRRPSVKEQMEIAQEIHFDLRTVQRHLKSLLK